MRAYKTKAHAIKEAHKRLSTMHHSVNYLCIVKLPNGYGISSDEFAVPRAIVRRGGHVEGGD
jgi:hypothetical protein